MAQGGLALLFTGQSTVLYATKRTLAPLSNATYPTQRTLLPSANVAYATKRTLTPTAAPALYPTRRRLSFSTAHPPITRDTLISVQDSATLAILSSQGFINALEAPAVPTLVTQTAVATIANPSDI